MKQLIVNADDFGRAPGINRGIIEAHHKGIVTSTTVMINYPAAPAGLEDALAQAPQLGMGLHLNLTAGRPVSSPDTVPSLVNAGGIFYYIRDWAAVFEKFDPEDIQREIAAQVQRFINLTGRPPDHLDAHHHATYLHPVALQAMLEHAHQYGIPLRNGGHDITPEEAVAVFKELVPAISETDARRLFDQLQAIIAQGPEPFWPARLELSFYDKRATLGDLLVILTTLPDDSLTEIMCHPGYVDEGLAGSNYTHQREDEIEHLTHPATRECVQAEGIHLITFGDVSH